MAITILLAEDHDVVRQGLRRLLEEEDMLVVGEAKDGLEAVHLTEQLSPQVVLMDISMPGLNGIEAAGQIKARFPQTAVVFLTMHESEEYFLAALRCGAEGYVPKSAPIAEVLAAIRCSVGGQVYLHPSVTRFLLQNFLSGKGSTDLSDPYHTLTEREREVLSLIAGGLTTQGIGEKLFLSPNTVHRHRVSLMQKLGLHSRLEILKYCIRRGLIDAST